MNNTLQETIIKNFGLSDFLEEEREEMIMQIGATIYEAVLTRAMGILTDEEQQEFEKIIDEERGPDALLTFLKEKIPSFHTIVQEEIEQLKREHQELVS